MPLKWWWWWWGRLQESRQLFLVSIIAFALLVKIRMAVKGFMVTVRSVGLSCTFRMGDVTQDSLPVPLRQGWRQKQEAEGAKERDIYVVAEREGEIMSWGWREEASG